MKREPNIKEVTLFIYSSTSQHQNYLNYVEIVEY